MREFWLLKIIEIFRLTDAIRAILLTAIKANPKNARWFKDKADRDAKNQPKPENYNYTLRAALGDKTFESIMTAAKKSI